MGGRASTHLIEFRADVVVKRYRSWSNGEPRREWQALKLLDDHATGLAPAPLSADLTGEPPSVVMSRLPGVPLSGTVSASSAACALAEVPADVLAATIARVQQAIPLRVLAELPERAGHPVELLRQVRSWCATGPPPGGDPVVAKAYAAAADWVERPALESSLGRPGRPVFGAGDGNLANYLWDGTEVRVVDFEYSGRSDRAYELAEVTEHISARAGDTIGMAHVLERFELDSAEVGRLMDCRRLLALFWLLRVRPGVGATEDRTRRDAQVSQARRLLGLL